MQTNTKSNQKSSTFSETKMDFKIAWQSLKGNYKAFIGTVIFAGLALFITLITLTSILILIVALIPTISVDEFFGKFSNNFGLSRIFRILIGLIAISIFYAFLNSQHGLAYDIMSSGEMFTEFKNSFAYFKKYWWQYPLLTFFLMIINTLFSLGYRFENSGSHIHNYPINIIQISLNIGELILFFIWFLLFIHTFPSLTSQGSFKRSYTESLRIIKSNPKRVISTWGTFFMIFVIPLITLGFFAEHFINLYLAIAFGIDFIFVIFIGFPMLSLLARGIYNNVEFQRFKPDLEEKIEEN